VYRHFGDGTSPLRQKLLHDARSRYGRIGQCLRSTILKIRELFVIDAHELEDRGVKIVNRYRILD
jgi:hypothetical protein